jgi:hypothetical protein
MVQDHQLGPGPKIQVGPPTYKGLSSRESPLYYDYEPGPQPGPHVGPGPTNLDRGYVKSFSNLAPYKYYMMKTHNKIYKFSVKISVIFIWDFILKICKTAHYQPFYPLTFSLKKVHTSDFSRKSRKMLISKFKIYIFWDIYFF